MKGHRLTHCSHVVVLLLLSSLIAQAAAPVTPGIEELYRLDRMAMFHNSIKVASVSSYDRTGGNNDGFGGQFSFVRKEDNGLVLADLTGPGVIYRLWTPTPTDDVMEFYFDGESEPRIRVKFRDLFMGKHPAFERPLVGYGAGGFYSYVPLPYEKSCKVLIRAERMQFYQINYATYPEDAEIATFTTKPTDAQRAHIEKAKKLFGSAGTDISAYVVPEGGQVETLTAKVTLQAGKATTLCDIKRPGRIVGLRMTPADALAGKQRDIILRAYWDGDAQPAILSPAGDFFGYAWGEPATKSLLVGTDDGGDYCYFPMPFDRSARLELYAEPDWIATSRLRPKCCSSRSLAGTTRASSTPCGAARIRRPRANPSRSSKPKDAVTWSGWCSSRKASNLAAPITSRATIRRPSTVSSSFTVPARRTSTTAAGTTSPGGGRHGGRSS